MTRLHRTLAVCVLLVGACSAAHDSLDEQLAMYDRVRDAECARALACETARQYAPLSTSYYCRRQGRGAERSAIAQGNAHVDMDAARACLAGIATLGDCVVRTSGGYPDVPSQPFEAECLRTLVYDRFPCGTTTCHPGTACLPTRDCSFECRLPAADGAPCTPFCGVNSWCVAGTCAPNPLECRGLVVNWRGFTGGCYRPLGAPCASPATPCVPGAYCSRAIATCVSTPALLRYGTPCDPNADPPCAFPWVCDAATRTCAPSATTGCGCGPGSYCNPAGACVSSPEGVFCNTHALDLGFVDECPAGYLCGPDAACHVPVALGGPCDPMTTACAPGTACTAGRCARIIAEGGACDDARPCARYLRCVAGACAVAPPLGTLGAPCRPDGTCSVGVCTAGSCAWLPDGSACSRPYDCPRCVAGVCQPPTVMLSRGDPCTHGDNDHVCGAGLSCTYGAYYPAPSFCCPTP